MGQMGRMGVIFLLAVTLGAAAPPQPNLMPVRTMPPPAPKGAVKLMELMNTVKQQKLAARVVAPPPKPAPFAVTFNGGAGGTNWYYSLQMTTNLSVPNWGEIQRFAPTNTVYWWTNSLLPPGPGGQSNYFRVQRLPN